MSPTLRGDHCRCTACHELFNSTKSFDRHRRGDYRTGDRQCLTPEAMRKAGMVKNSDGWWITAARGNGSGDIRGDAGSGEVVCGVRM